RWCPRRTADVPARPPAPGGSAHRRDHVPRRGRARLRLHVRLKVAAQFSSPLTPQQHTTERNRMLLSDKVAVIYGARGAIGGAVARAFAAEGAQVFATGREVDALDEQAVDRHLQSVVDAAGRVDISFDAIGVPDSTVVGVPLVDMDFDRFALPIAAYTTSYFLTARLAARRMAAQGSGVIMTATPLLARIGATL